MNILKYIIHRIIFRYGLTKIFTRLPFIRDTYYYINKNRLIFLPTTVMLLCHPKSIAAVPSTQIYSVIVVLIN